MSERPAVETADAATLPGGEETRDSVEVYESDGATVLYDAENPLAWLESEHTLTVAEQV